MSDTRDRSRMGIGSHNRPDTLERLLTYCAAISPQHQALADPPNRNHLEGRSDELAARRFSFEELDQVVTRTAARFAALGLKSGDYVALQLPNFVEAPILVLALMRARLVPCLLPLSWSIEEITSSFERLKPKALISCGQVEGINYSENMRELAFSNIHIRFVLASGYNIADGVSDISSLFDIPFNEVPESFSIDENSPNLNDQALVTYIDPVTPVPHSNGQMLATGLLHVLELGLSSDDHMLSAYPLSSIPGLAAHMYPWLMTACSMALHHPFDFGVLHDQLRSGPFSYFAAPEQVIDWLLKSSLPVPQKLAIVRRDSHLPPKDLKHVSSLQLFDLWNIGGLGSVPVRRICQQPPGVIFPKGRICLPSTTDQQLCLAAAKILDNRLFIKGRIFPNTTSIKAAFEWISLKKRFGADDWLDTGLAAFQTSDGSVLLGADLQTNQQKTAS